MTELAIVAFADVVGSRRDAPGAADALRRVVRELDEAFAGDRLAPFGFTQGDELQGLLRPEADPLAVFSRVELGDHAVGPMRWAFCAGSVDAGEGPATQRTGEAFVRARDLVDEARRRRERLLLVTGDSRADELLADLAPVLVRMLDELSPTQRAVARLAILEGMRQVQIAAHLGVTRSSVSLTYGRARVSSIEGLVRAMGRIVRRGIEGARAGSTRAAGTAPAITGGRPDDDLPTPA